MTRLRYPNLTAAHTVMVLDQGISPTDGLFERKALPYLITGEANGDWDIDRAEDSLSRCRAPADLDNCDSQLWVLCAGEQDDAQALGAELCGEDWTNLNAVLEEIFIAVGC